MLVLTFRLQKLDEIVTQLFNQFLKIYQEIKNKEKIVHSREVGTPQLNIICQSPSVLMLNQNEKTS